MSKIKVTTVKMKDINFDPSLFRPMKSGRVIDAHFSSQKGLMKGTNYAIVGDPGIGKTTAVLQLAKENNLNFVKLNLAQIEELGDLVGFPVRQFQMYKEKQIQKKLDDWW